MLSRNAVLQVDDGWMNADAAECEHYGDPDAVVRQVQWCVGCSDTDEMLL